MYCSLSASIAVLSVARFDPRGRAPFASIFDRVVLPIRPCSGHRYQTGGYPS